MQAIEHPVALGRPLEEPDSFESLDLSLYSPDRLACLPLDLALVEATTWVQEKEAKDLNPCCRCKQDFKFRHHFVYILSCLDYRGQHLLDLHAEIGLECRPSLVLPKHMPHDATDLAKCCIFLDGTQYVWHQIVVRARTGFKATQGV